MRMRLKQWCSAESGTLEQGYAPRAAADLCSIVSSGRRCVTLARSS